MTEILKINNTQKSASNDLNEKKRKINLCFDENISI